MAERAAGQPIPRAPGQDTPEGGLFAAFAAPEFVRLWAAGAVWNLSRWMGIFLGAYLVNELTGSPLLVQMVGGAMFVPMFLGGLVAGTVSDRFERRNTTLVALTILTPLATLMGLAATTGTLEVWMVYPFMLLMGTAGVVDNTSRRALIYDVVGKERVTNALALESLSMSGGNMLGALTGGAIIAALGVGQAYVLMAMLYGVALLLMATVKPRPLPERVGPKTSMLRDLRDGVAMLRVDPVMKSLFGVTFVMNQTLFSFTPLIPVFADRLDANALFTGLLGSGSGAGMMIGAFWLAGHPPKRRGILHVVGAVMALVFLFVFAASLWYWVSFVALIGMGIGISGYGTTQAVLYMLAATDETRGRALGLMSMGVGSVPLGMVLMGSVAEAVGAATAVMLSTTVGLLAVGTWTRRHPETLAMR